MNRKTKTIMLSALIMLSGLDPSGPRLDACSTAVISPAASAGGGAMLWKNRDTDFLSNKVVFVKAQPYSYLGLVNAEDQTGRFVYAGLNDQGLGIMNSVAYNLYNEKNEMADLEGIIMAEALRTCRTVADFERFIRANLGESLGSQANFGVIDASGRALLFEVANRSCEVFNSAAEAPSYLVNTNFARSGKEGAGAGYLRFEQVSRLLAGLQGGKISHEFIFQNLARDFGHPLLRHPSPAELERSPADPPTWLYTNDSINRPSTSAAVVINGRDPGRSDRPATFWVLLGEPVCGIALPFWVEAGETPAAVWAGQDAALTRESLRLKNKIRPLKAGNQKNYLNAGLLANLENSGFLRLIMDTEQEIFRETALFLAKKRSRAEMVTFQEKMAEKALSVLSRI